MYVYNDERSRYLPNEFVRHFDKCHIEHNMTVQYLILLFVVDIWQSFERDPNIVIDFQSISV